MRYQKTMAVVISCGVMGAAVSSDSDAAAFQLKEKSAKAQGRAFAGSISTPGDASVIADNAAAMRLLDGRLLQVDLTAIDYSIEFDGGGDSPQGQALSGGNGGDAGDLAAVPAVYFYTPINEQMHLGFSITAPFGFETDYDRDWIGRYQGIRTRLQAIDAGASFSYDINSSFSIGGSVFVERAEAELIDAIDFGAVLAGANIPGFSSGSADGHTHIEATDYAPGYTIGILFSPLDGTHFGASYRSEVNHKLSDVDVNFDVPANVAPIIALARPGWFTDTQASTELKFPAMLILSATHELSPRWSIMADVARTYWGEFKEVKLDFDSPQDDNTLNFGYRDTTFWSIGTEYKVSDQLTLRSGVGYDETPVTNDVRDVRVPDVNRKWLSMGATWRPSQPWEFNLGYTHLFVDDPEVNLESVTDSTLSGSFELNSNVLAASTIYRF